ncbi:DUF624 domain-containing protein [Agromyces intestinalis]|uniref:DUF624 domain-containing protein n=1 Tax=Agromyces intestinalis TaxID=2592652 RepID=A0A5C1YH97_9MICO|nr:DUF624 domain-containing protein [Agromyces intestinalis]QEO14469.1 DUF624 domain-containing protein [Agromyces intestinalis]
MARMPRTAFDRITGTVYRMLVAELAFLAAVAPGILGMLFLQPHPSNIPLYALCLVPLGPALAAVIGTFRALDGSHDLVVWPRFWRAWWRDLRDVLLVWVPALVVLTVLAINVAFAAAAGVDPIFAVIAIVLAAVVGVLTLHALVIAAVFSFRTRDVARLALMYLVAKPLASVGALAVLIVVATAAATGFAWLIALAGSLLGVFLLANSRAMVADITARFTDEPNPRLAE